MPAAIGNALEVIRQQTQHDLWRSLFNNHLYPLHKSEIDALLVSELKDVAKSTEPLRNEEKKSCARAQVLDIGAGYGHWCIGWQIHCCVDPVMLTGQ